MTQLNLVNFMHACQNLVGSIKHANRHFVALAAAARGGGGMIQLAAKHLSKHSGTLGTRSGATGASVAMAVVATSVATNVCF